MTGNRGIDSRTISVHPSISVFAALAAGTLLARA